MSEAPAAGLCLNAPDDVLDTGVFHRPGFQSELR